MSCPLSVLAALPRSHLDRAFVSTAAQGSKLPLLNYKVPQPQDCRCWANKLEEFKSFVMGFLKSKKIDKITTLRGVFALNYGGVR